jgi:hypothetical protein
LAHAAIRLQAERIACFVPLDRWENMRQLEPDRLVLRLAGRLIQVAVRGLKLQISTAIREYLVAAGVLDDNGVIPHQRGFTASPRTILHQAIAEVSRLTHQGRITYLIDGLEKAGPDRAAALFEELAALPDSVDVVVVVPWYATFGARPDAIVRPGERFVAMRAVEVDGATGAAGRTFFLTMLARRLGINPDTLNTDATTAALAAGSDSEHLRVRQMRALLSDAAQWSGGVPRTFLQLVADASTYARLRNSDSWPIETDLSNAVSDQQDTFRRLLLPGDTAAIRANVGTDGRELDLPRKVRLMAHGVLLERMRERRPILEVHPLARLAIDEGSGDA